jgi:hypothetical protein
MRGIAFDYRNYGYLVGSNAAMLAGTEREQQMVKKF